MTPRQCKMARVALDWTVKDLAEKSGVMPNTVSRFERGMDAYASTASKFQTALEATGKVKFEGDSCVCVVSQDDERA